MIQSIPKYWKDKLFVAYARSNNHPIKLRLLGWLKDILGLDKILAKTDSGVYMYLNPIDYVQYAILYQGCYEPLTLKLLTSLSKESTNFLDIGSHTGQYALEIAKNLNQNGKVIAIEPNPRTFTYLLENIRINKFKNIIPILGAASDVTSLIRMQSPPESNWGKSKEYQSNNFIDNNINNTYFTATFKLDNLLLYLNINHIDIVKIDIEGHEIKALKGLLDSNKYSPKHIIFEFIPDSFEDAEATVNYLKEKGYSLYNIVGEVYNKNQNIPECNLWARKD